MWVASTPPCVATTSVEYVQSERLCGVGDGSHGLEHGISDLCQGQSPGPFSDGGAGEGSFPDKEAICVV